MTPRALALAALLAAPVAVCVAAPAALACVPAPSWPAKARLSPPKVARTMVAAATYIDLVRVEALTPDFEVGTRNPEGWSIWLGDEPDAPKTMDEVLKIAREDWADNGVRIHYRVVERLKGASADTFTLDGVRLTTPPPGVAYPADMPLRDLTNHLDQQDLAAWPAPGACETPLFVTGEGMTLLVFRDAAGRLLRAPVEVKFMGRASQIPGPAHVRVSGPDGAWVKVVRAALALAQAQAR